VDAIIAHYRPRLEGKLCLNLDWSVLGDEQLEPYRLLGMRIGDKDAWLGKTGVKRKPRVALKHNDEKSLRSYIAEANPDLGFLYRRNEHEWRKRGMAGLPSSTLYWGYAGFDTLAATLDRHINAPWRKLVRPPWPDDTG